MDIKVVQTDHNQINIFTRAGTQLVGDRAATMHFRREGIAIGGFAMGYRSEQVLGRHARCSTPGRAAPST